MCMQINTVCKKYNLSRKTIHFYIQSGLLHPSRSDNNYYSFSESNLEELELILRLRKSGVSIENIQNILTYPTCANFFLFKQYFQLRREQVRIASSQANIQRILQEIPPNGTYTDILNMEETYLRKEKQDFSDKDASITARMTSIFLLTPFMHQKVDTYRQFLWARMEAVTETRLEAILPDIARHLTLLTAKEVYTLSTSLAQKFIAVEKGETDRMLHYMQEQVKKLCTDPHLQQLWKTSYVPFITPVKALYREYHKTLIRQYTSSYAECMESMKILLQTVYVSLPSTTLETLHQVTGYPMDMEDAYYNDLFILFCMEDSVFFHSFKDRK